MPAFGAFTEKLVNDFVGNTVANLVRMAFGNGLAREKIIFPGHFQISDGFEEELNNCGAGGSHLPAPVRCVKPKRPNRSFWRTRFSYSRAGSDCSASVVTRSSTRFRTLGSRMRAKARLRCRPSVVDKKSTTYCDEDFLSESAGRRWRAARWRAFEEKGRRHVQRLRNLLQAARADTIGALLVFLHLLKSDSERVSKLLLTHFHENSLHANAAADVTIDRIWRLLQLYRLLLSCSRIVVGRASYIAGRCMNFKKISVKRGRPAIFPARTVYISRPAR